METMIPPLLSKVLTHNFSASRAHARFRSWHVETNLNRASDLLDRTLADRQLYQALRAQGQNLSLLLEEEDSRISDDEKRATAGVFDGSTLEAKNKAEVISKSLGHFTNVINPYLAKTHALAETPVYLLWQTGAAIHQNFIQEELMTYDRDAANRQNVVARADSDITKAALVAARARLGKKFSALGKDGDLSFFRQAEVVAARISRDLEDAVDRLTVASEGLWNIYGFSKLFEFAPVDSIHQIDYAVLWARDAIRWLNAFSQLDQSFTISMSLRKLLEENWSDVIEGDAAFFALPDGLFPHHRYVRLRGVTASLVLTTESSYAANLALSPPKFGKIIQGENEIDKTMVLDQRLVPSCLLGAVRSAKSTLQPEAAGAISLMNISPIPGSEGDDGSWKVRLNHGSIDPDLIKDVIVDLKLTGRPR
jgi:hypothetical protein